MREPVKSTKSLQDCNDGSMSAQNSKRSQADPPGLGQGSEDNVGVNEANRKDAVDLLREALELNHIYPWTC